ncbi:CDC50/LEM3 family, partial [Gorgonomyces haynaldii]
DTAFKQQRLKSWQPLLTPKTVIPTFFIVGLIFIPVGIGLYIASSKVVQVQFDYSTCSTAATATLAAPTDNTLGIKQWKFDNASKVCTIHFDVPTDMPAPVYMYYRLTNFYQNNRRYVKSFDLKQLKGDTNVPENCDPLGKVDTTTDPVKIRVNGSLVDPLDGAIYYPCGLIANSLFSADGIGPVTCHQSSFNFPQGVCSPSSSTIIVYNISDRGIAWPSDADRYLPTTWTQQENWQRKIVPPPFWRQAFPKWAEGYNATNIPNLKTWEQFQVWMRTAGLPTFRKLWGSNVDTMLPAGTWKVEITQNFDVNKFGGTKSIVLSTASILGGQNPFLGSAYIVVGTICWALGLAFLARHMIKPRKLGDHSYLSWNKVSNRPAAGPEQVHLLR